MKSARFFDPRFHSMLNIWQASIGQPHWQIANAERTQGALKTAHKLRSERFLPVTRGIKRMLSAVWAQYQHYRLQNLSRRELMRLSDHYLQDIGLTRDDVKQRSFELVDTESATADHALTVTQPAVVNSSDSGMGRVKTSGPANDPLYRPGRKIA